MLHGLCRFITGHNFFSWTAPLKSSKGVAILSFFFLIQQMPEPKQGLFVATLGVDDNQEGINTHRTHVSDI